MVGALNYKWFNRGELKHNSQLVFGTVRVLLAISFLFSLDVSSQTCMRINIWRNSGQFWWFRQKSVFFAVFAVFVCGFAVLKLCGFWPFLVFAVLRFCCVQDWLCPSGTKRKGLSWWFTNQLRKKFAMSQCKNGSAMYFCRTAYWTRDHLIDHCYLKMAPDKVFPDQTSDTPKNISKWCIWCPWLNLEH